MIIDRQMYRRHKEAKLRNREAIHPVMKTGGPHRKSNKSARSSSKAELRRGNYDY